MAAQRSPHLSCGIQPPTSKGDGSRLHVRWGAMSRRVHTPKNEITIASGHRSRSVKRSRRGEADSHALNVTDTWPSVPSVAEKETAVVETFLGRLIDQLLSGN